MSPNEATGNFPPIRRSETMPNPQQFVKFPAVQWDAFQPKLTPECWSLFCAMVRKTIGWDKTEDTISTSQLIAMTGMKERRIQRNMKKLMKSGVPVRVVSTGNQGVRYAYDGSIPPVTGDTPVNLTPLTPPVTGDTPIESGPSLVTPPPLPRGGPPPAP